MEKNDFVAALVVAYDSFRDGRRFVAGWVDLRHLWKKMHASHRQLKLSEFKELLWQLHSEDFVRFDLARASIARPHVARYGISTKRGVYFYFKLRPS